MRPNIETQLARESESLTRMIDKACGTSAAERRAALDQRIADRLAAIGKSHYRPHPLAVALPSEVLA